MYCLAHSMSIKVVAQKVSIIKAPFGLSERRIELWFGKIEQNDNSCASFVHVLVNSSSPIVRQWIGSALVQIMACRLFGAKPLSKKNNAGLLSIGPLGTNFGGILIKIQNFHSRKYIWQYRLRNDIHFAQGENDWARNEWLTHSLDTDARTLGSIARPGCWPPSALPQDQRIFWICVRCILRFKRLKYFLAFYSNLFLSILLSFGPRQGMATSSLFI